MPAFSLTPASGFPPVTADEFPQFVQFQNEGVDLGGPDADTVDFVGAGVTATRGVGANANKVTVAIPGGGGGAAPVLVVSLSGSVSGGIFSASLQDWPTADIRQTSSDASWNATTQRVEFSRTGIYEVVVRANIFNSSNPWPTGPTLFGAECVSSGALPPSTSRYGIHRPDTGFPTVSAVSPTDTFLVNVDDIGADFVRPRVYADNYGGLVGATLSFSALLLVRRIGDAFSVGGGDD